MHRSTRAARGLPRPSTGSGRPEHVEGRRSRVWLRRMLLVGTAVAAAASLVERASQAQQPQPYTKWDQYGGSSDSMQYSALAQINKIQRQTTRSAPGSIRCRESPTASGSIRSSSTTSCTCLASAASSSRSTPRPARNCGCRRCRPPTAASRTGKARIGRIAGSFSPRAAASANSTRARAGRS